MKHILFLFCLGFLFSCGDDQSGPDDITIMEYLTEQNITNATKTEDGIYFIPIFTSSSVEFPNINNTVTVDYVGYFLNDNIFDDGDDISFGLWQVIEGWQKGIPLLSKGSSGTLIIPSGLAYGSSGSGSIPGNTVLAFDVTLHDFD